jgi:hypothetical protein
MVISTIQEYIDVKATRMETNIENQKALSNFRKRFLII